MAKLFNAFLLTAAAGGAAALLWRSVAADGAGRRSKEEPHLPGAASPEVASSEKRSAREVEADALSDVERTLLADELRAQL